MTNLSTEGVLPVLVADLADDESRNVLEAAAAAGTSVIVPLVSAPVSASRHVLEVHLPSSPEPVLFLAEPLGPPTEQGFPLRLLPMPNAPPSVVPPAPSHDNAVVKPRRGAPNVVAISASHRQDIASIAPPPAPTPPPEDTLVGRALAGGKLKIESLIGRGGVGAVYKARHRELKIFVAVKVLHESFQDDIDFCRRFYAEGLAASRMDHPNITRVIDFGQENDGLLYLAMEFLDGKELRNVVEQEGTLTIERIVGLMMQVCAGLSHAHARGIVHRDIKPENLVLVAGLDDDENPTEIVKVCDFGIAQQRQGGNTQDRVIAGTPEYMSPEQCRGDELDARTDIYACGVVLYELSTGCVPFTDERMDVILQRQQSARLPLPSTVKPDLDPRFEAIIVKALQKDPAARYQSMKELRSALRELLNPVIAAAPQDARASALEPASPADGPAGRDQARGDIPDWLERGGAYAMGAPAAGAAPPSPAVVAAIALDDEPKTRRHRRPKSEPPEPPPQSPDDVADLLVENPTGWLTGPDDAAFHRMTQGLDAALRVLAARGSIPTLVTIYSALQQLAAAATNGPGSRAYVARRSLPVFEDPSLLSAVAEQILIGHDEARDAARRLVVNAGVSGAHGLYGARALLGNTSAMRAAFVTTLKTFGVNAWPVVRAALEQIHAGDQSPPALELAEDLLLAVPAVGDESAGHVVVKYLKVSVAGVCRAAATAIVKLWRERAQPLLVGMLQSRDDVVRISGITGLRQLDAIDEHIVPKLYAILMRRVPAGDELRATAAIAMGYAHPRARPAHHEQPRRRASVGLADRHGHALARRSPPRHRRALAHGRQRTRPPHRRGGARGAQPRAAEVGAPEARTRDRLTPRVTAPRGHVPRFALCP